MDKRTMLSTLWVFLTVNFIFCDVFTLMHAGDLKNLMEGKVGDTEITQGFLLTFAFIMEIPMLMILLSRILKQPLNRVLNIIAGILLTLVQAWSLTQGKPTLHYVFFSVVEIATTVFITWYAFRWKPQEG